MSVYVDNMRAPFGRMIMCHMIADSTEELVSMANKIGVKSKWIQYPSTPQEHFDISIAKRNSAVYHGAVEITLAQCGAMTKRRGVEGILGLPEESEEWLRTYIRSRNSNSNMIDEVSCG